MSSAFGAAALTSGSPTVISLAVFSLGTTLLGSISWAFAHRRAKLASAKWQEQRMIAVAKTKNGRVTDVELVAETRHTLGECRAFNA